MGAIGLDEKSDDYEKRRQASDSSTLRGKQISKVNFEDQCIRFCYGVNVCVPTNLYVEILMLNVMVLGGGAFRRSPHDQD